ncbi:MAG TPA: response regulator [Polyangiaceae bacterium]|jgi:two-component system chemotaxis sensor kinase CheA
MQPDPYRYFRVEARDLLDQLGKTILELEKAPTPELVARLLRIAHTLKGAARVVKQPEVADGAHALEDAVATARGSSEPLPRERIDGLLALVDGMSARVRALGVAPGGDGAPSRSEEQPGMVRTDTGEVDELLEGVNELRSQLAPLRRALEGVERAQRLAEVVVDQLVSPRATDALHLGSARANAEELRGLLSGLERTVSTGVDLAHRELAQVRRTAERLRLVPARAMFTSLERTARDTALTLRKNVVFEGRGGEVRIDAQVLNAVQNGLVQVVRNAVAHGIEAEAERRSAGKPGAGRLTLDVTRRGRLVSFAATDDGRGVDLEAVRRAAQRRGLTPEATKALGTNELLRMLLGGGVSTASTVTEVSGRGVGLDVVRETAERFGGEVRVSTRAGAGTTVELLVPVSVSSQEALLVRASGVTAALPLDSVEQAMRLRGADVARTATGEAVVHEGRAIPFLALGAALGGAPSHPPTAWSAVVVRGAGGAAVVGVDRLLGTRSVVLRPLPRLAPAAAIVAGATLDEDGDPQLVLDPDAVVLAARQAHPQARADSTPRRASVLVIDDSLTTRMLERSILEVAGYEVDVAASGEEGLEKARATRYALFLVDIEMPGMDGFTFIERTRADPATRDVPAILVSSRASQEDRQRGRAVGAIDYMVKSEFDQTALLARIREHVG